MSKKGSTCPIQQYSSFCDRVKMVDIHPKEPLYIGALYTGVVNLWNFETRTLVKSFDTGTGLPVRCARFIPRLQSFVCGCDDMQVRVYNCNTMERTNIFQAHDDYIRSLAVHDQLPIVLTASDDMTIRQWDWSNGWTLQMTYEGHMHYCMAVAFNPCDPSTFASASLDGTVKVWTINNPVPNYQLEGHEDGVNCVEYYPRGDKPYLLSGSDDQTVRLWDYQTKACLQVFSYHSANVTAVLFHPEKPLIFTIAEDSEMKVISSETFRLLHNIDHTVMQRGWSLAAKRSANVVIAGYDRGVEVFKVGEDKPVYSMDTNGRIILTSGNEVSRIDIKGISADTPDGEVLSLPSKDLGAVESTADRVLHGPGGQCIALIGEHDYTIVSTLALRPKSYGSSLSFAWGSENGSYAVLASPTQVQIHKAFKQVAFITVEPSVKLFPGPLLGVRTHNSIIFYHWKTLTPVRIIDEVPNSVEWSPSGELVALATDTAVYILKFNTSEVEEYVEQHGTTDPNGLDFSFDLIEELEEKVRDSTWVGDCLVFITAAHRLNYYIGGEMTSVAVLSRNQYLLGYLTKENRIFCIDKERNITSYQLKVQAIEYMAAIVREDFEAADEIFATIDNSFKHKLAQFLENRGLLDRALAITTEDDHRFDLAVRLKRLDLVKELAVKTPSPARWKQVGDISLSQGFIPLATTAYMECGDFNGLLLIYTSTNDKRAISDLGDKSLAKGKTNLAFTCFHLAKRHADNVDLLYQTGKFGEAAFYARTYCHGKIEEAVSKWKVSLATVPRLKEAIASPVDYPNLFPALKLEDLVAPVAQQQLPAAIETSPIKEVTPMPPMLDTNKHDDIDEDVAAVVTHPPSAPETNLAVEEEDEQLVTEENRYSSAQHADPVALQNHDDAGDVAASSSPSETAALEEDEEWGN